MPFTKATIQSAGNHIGTLVTHASIHTADPGATGTSESTAARKAVALTTDVNGVITISGVPVAFTGGAANGPAAWVGLWSASTGGTFRGAFQITTGDVNFNAAGEYNLTQLTVTGS